MNTDSKNLSVLFSIRVHLWPLVRRQVIVYSGPCSPNPGQRRVPMKPQSSRRNFLASGLALPAAALGAPLGGSPEPQAAAQTPSNEVKLTYRTLGNTGLKVTSLSFGCMTTSDASVIEHAADIGIVHFDTARRDQSGNNERSVGASRKGNRQRGGRARKSAGK